MTDRLGWLGQHGPRELAATDEGWRVVEWGRSESGALHFQSRTSSPQPSPPCRHGGEGVRRFQRGSSAESCSAEGNDSAGALGIALLLALIAGRRRRWGEEKRQDARNANPDQ